jgi:hypothetical protein
VIDDHIGSKEIHCLNTGSEKDRMTTMLSITSSGMFLPMFVIFKGKNPPKDTIA